MHVFYNEVLPNLWLMIRMLAKTALYTGIGPGIAAFLIVRKIRERQTTRTKARVIEFPTWGERTVPGKMMEPLPRVSLRHRGSPR
jgi:hypothetical protein